MRLYLDANAITYSVEGLPGFQAGVSRWVRQVEAAAGLLITSRLSMLECRVGPLRQGDQGALTRYEAFSSGDNLAVFDVGPDVIGRATDLRVRYGFRSPDAIHLATAILVEAEVFLTGDARLARCTVRAVHDSGPAPSVLLAMHQKRQSADASRLAALLVGQILPVFSLLGALPSGRLDALGATASSLTGH